MTMTSASVFIITASLRHPLTTHAVSSSHRDTVSVMSTSARRSHLTLHDESFEHFFDEGLIEAVLLPLKHGKEASVHLCRANPRTTGEELVALKLYHPLNKRDFRDEGLYRDGEFIKERRIRAALEQKTKFGREVQGGLWVSREWETLPEALRRRRARARGRSSAPTTRSS